MATVNPAREAMEKVLGTTSTVGQSGPVYDPNAKLNTELATLKQQNATMMSSLAKPIASATATAPAQVDLPTAIRNRWSNTPVLDMYNMPGSRDVRDSYNRYASEMAKGFNLQGQRANEMWNKQSQALGSVLAQGRVPTSITQPSWEPAFLSPIRNQSSGQIVTYFMPMMPGSGPITAR